MGRDKIDFNYRVISRLTVITILKIVYSKAEQ